MLLERLDKTLAHSTAATIVLASVFLAAGCGSGAGGRSSGASTTQPPSASSLAPVRKPYAPSIDPANFVRTVDNPYWPLKPGTGFHFTGVRGQVPQTDDEVVTHRTKRILGIRCTVVRDTVAENGKAVERTFDYYAQDKQGNVWYMG